MSEQATSVTSAKAINDARGPLVRACAAEYAGSLSAGYAACTMKNDVNEGLSPDQAARARAWKRTMLSVAADHFQRIAQITNIGIALGVFEQTTPGPVSAAAGAAGLQLRPFAVSALPNTDVQSVPIDLRAAFVSYIEWGSRIAVENSQPGAAPPPNMPVPQWWWACNATPRTRVSALAPQQVQEPVALPGPDEDVSFAAHIKPLFRAMDRNSMKFVFDLWAVDDVTTHADSILRRLREGTMPCDGAWPTERIEVFQRWVETGMTP